MHKVQWNTGPRAWGATKVGSSQKLDGESANNGNECYMPNEIRFRDNYKDPIPSDKKVKIYLRGVRRTPRASVFQVYLRGVRRAPLGFR